MFRYLVFIGFLLLGSIALAESFQAPAAAQLLAEQQEKGHFRIAKGRIRGVNNRWQFEQEDNVDGLANSRTWQLDDSVNYMDHVDYITAWLKETDANIVYQCQGRSCGASNIWANNYFNDWRLYGPDDRQYLWVSQQQQSYRVLYLIERGNRKVYLHEKQVKAEQSIKQQAHIFSTCDAEALAALAHEKGIVLISSPDDKEQSVSLQLVKQCQQRLNQAELKTVPELIALGSFDRHWQRVNVVQYEWVRLD